MVSFPAPNPGEALSARNLSPISLIFPDRWNHSIRLRKPTLAMAKRQWYFFHCPITLSPIMCKITTKQHK